MASFWYNQARDPQTFSAAGGEADLSEIATAAQKQMELVDNTNGRYSSIYQAYDNRIAAIRAATGQAVENPLKRAEALDAEAMRAPRRPNWQRSPFEEQMLGPAMPTNEQRETQAFQTWLTEMAARYPDAKAAIGADRPIIDDARALARQSEEEAARLGGSRSGVGSLAAQFYGGFVGSLKDPLQAATLLIGGGPSAGRSVAAVVAKTALKEALINGAVEAALQPQVQAWRSEAGLPAGFKEAAVNVLFAAAGGAVLGGGAEAVGAGARRVFTGRWLDAAAEEAAKVPTVKPEIREALKGDSVRAAEALTPIREALPPEARAAIDVIEADKAIPLPAQASPEIHAKNLDRAAAAVERGDMAFEPVIDPARIDRITNLIAPDAPKTPKSRTDDLATFLMRAGGVQDQKGEITALGLQKQSRAFTGKLVRDDGMTLDHAREVAAESGFFDHKYGTPDEAVAKSTIADLLDELDAGARRAEQPTDDGGRAYAEARVSEMLKLVGPDVDDRLVADAVDLAERENIDLIDAFDRVALQAEQTAEPQGARAPDPMSYADFVEPDAIDEAELFTPDDLEGIDPLADIPFFDDGRMATGPDIVADIEDTFGLFQLTQSCKV